MPIVQSIDVSKARNSLSKLMEMVYFQKQRFIIERRNIPMAVMIPVDEFAKLEPEKPSFSEEEIKKKLAAVKRISGLGLRISDNWEKVEKEIAKAHAPNR